MLRRIALLVLFRYAFAFGQSCAANYVDCGSCGTPGACPYGGNDTFGWASDPEDAAAYCGYDDDFCEESDECYEIMVTAVGRCEQFGDTGFTGYNGMLCCES